MGRTYNIALGLLFALVVSASAQQEECALGGVERGVFVGKVRDRWTRVPLAGALVTADWPGQAAPLQLRTDSAGRIRICTPFDQLITVRISYLHIQAVPRTAYLTRTRTTEHDFDVDVPAVTVRGRVTEKSSRAAVQHALVSLVNTPLRTQTDSAGYFLFQRVPAGDYRLQVEHLAYSTTRTLVEVREEDLQAAIRLTPAAIPLAPVIVTVFSPRLEQTGFYEREKRGVGTFIGRQQVETMNVQRSSDLLRRVPSARIIPQSSRRNMPQNAVSGRGSCRYRYVVDGARTLGDFDMDLLSPHAIEGIEVYHGLAEVPAVFRAITSSDGGSQICGVVVIWTKDRR